MDVFIFFMLFSSIFLHIEAVDTNFPPVRCSHDGPDIMFPFSIQGLQPQDCSYPGFKFLCRKNETIIRFPSYGDLVVKSISYHDIRKLSLLDPKNCVHEVFLNLNLSGTPFQYFYDLKKYSYLNCSAQLSPSFVQVPCLSGSGHHVYVVESFLPVPVSCELVKTISIPFSYSPYLSDNSFGLGFTWDLTAGREDFEDEGGRWESWLVRCFNEALGKGQSSLGDGVAKNLESYDIMRYSPVATSSTTASHSVSAQPPVSEEMDDLDVEGQQNETVPEEPSSSFSEAGDGDDPLPAIEGLEISGEAFPGREIQACGFAINGTTSCNFEWVRHLGDGSVNYIEGAKQPNYLVTADDVDTYLAIEVQPLGNRKRKGELVTVFTNEHRKITCDAEMQNYIEKALHNGHASYRVSLSTEFLDKWELATLAIKREGYSIRGDSPSSVLVTEKFSPTTMVNIRYGFATQFSIIGSGGVERILRAESSSTDGSGSRDTIVLTLRLFITKAGEERKGKKRGFFFKQ